MIQCLLVDDEPLALDLLEDNLRLVPSLELAGRCRNAFEAMEILQKKKIDLIFLDIQMPGITGLQFLQGLKNPPLVILVTAYDKFALDGFNLDVLDYLVKPVAPERFIKAAHKALDLYRLTHLNPPPENKPEAEYLFVNADYNLVKIVIGDITHVEGLKDYIKIHLSTAPRPVITRMSLKAIEEKLPGNKFIRVHKSFIISLSKMISIRNNRIKLENAEVPVSEFYRENLFKRIEDSHLSGGS
ncbi:MAG TPA: LytTR family DNA-binding domain-containing protein [Bacteroidia bacterium]|jgi:two-component system LytT family response regulator|nr:LytTR family DNA-binding domain-containing protein [Bacteroidia bacterium]